MKANVTVPAAALAAALLPLLAGCVSAPAPRRADTAWTPPPETQRADDVWTGLRAQTPELSKPLTLADVTDLALRNNPATRQAWQQARAASAVVRQAEGYFMPTVTGIAEADRRGVSSDRADLRSDYLSYGPGVQVNYLIFNFGGGRQAAVQQALQSVYAANFNFNRAIQDAVLSAQLAYHGVLGAQAAVEAAQATVTDTETALEAARTRLNAGLGVELEVLQAQAGLDQARFTLANARGQLASARGFLAQALALPADTDVQIAPPAAELPAELPETDMRRLMDEALARRPDIAALRASRAAREAAVKVAGSSAWPSLYLNGSLLHNSYETYSGKDMGNDLWPYGAALSLQWTLFDGLQTASARRAAEAQAQAAGETLRQAELAASADVWNRYQQYRTALDRHRFASASLASATASHRLALDSYKAGLTGILDVLAAEAQLAQARSVLAGARQDVFASLAQLAHATGRLESGAAQAAAPSLLPEKERKP